MKINGTIINLRRMRINTMDLELITVKGHFFNGSFSAEGFFSGLPTKARHSLSSISRTAQFSKDTTVVAEKQLPAIYMLKEGRAETILFNRLNRRFAFHTVARDEMIGLTETINGLQFELTVKTITPCIFQLIEKKEFMRFLHDQPEVCYQLVKQLGQDIATTSNAFASASFH